MTILTLIKPFFNRLHNNRLYGLDEIPQWHPLYGKKVHRCGWYIRKLNLYDKHIIEIVVYRFYFPELKKTYSLLPFFISRYERHINTVIEDTLYKYLVEGISPNNLAEEPAPSPWTIRRWVGKYVPKLEHFEESAEALLVKLFSLRPVCNKLASSFKELFDSYERKAEEMEKDLNFLRLYGSFSYITYASGIKNAKF
jgi:hypothetical protein